MSDAAQLISALAGFVAAIAALYATVHNGRRIQEVKHEVTTANGQTLAVLTDAIEGRRIQAIAPEDRTEIERRHADELGDPDK